MSLRQIDFIETVKLLECNDSVEQLSVNSFTVHRLDGKVVIISAEGDAVVVTI